MDKIFKFQNKNHKPETLYLNPKVLVGLSGGVDSSVAAAILKKQGYQVIGVFLKFTPINTNSSICATSFTSEESEPTSEEAHKLFTNKHESENKCCNYESLVSARSVAEKLDIPFYVMDASKEFKREVVDYFINEYDNGRTPNPCVICNKKIKFGWMLEQAKKLGCDYIATGHYARIKCSLATSQKDVHFFHGAQASGKRLQPTFCDCARSLYQACDKKKDQSYFLWQLNQEQLAHILFPIGDYTKEEVRKMAKDWDLPTASKQESQDLCFISTDKTEFLANYANKLNKPGIIVDKNGNILGRHKGLCHYTVGQRQGIGVQIQNPKSQIPNKSKISNLKTNYKSKTLPTGRQVENHILNSSFQPIYVIRLDTDKNQLVVGPKEDLNSCDLVADKVNWIKLSNKEYVTPREYSGQVSNKADEYQAKIRYGSSLSLCHIVYHDSQRSRRVTLSQNKIRVIFDEPQRAITPGQSIVFYQDEELVGGGIIK